jgi:transposase-like protein
MAMARQVDHGKEKFWRRVVEQCGRRTPGVTIRDFCAEHGLAEPSFYAWRRIIAERDQQVTSTSTSDCNHHVDNQPIFLPVHLVPTPVSASLELVLDKGLVIRVPPGFDAATLRQLLAVLEEEPSC